MSVSGGPPSIGARKARGECPHWPGETLVNCLHVGTHEFHYGHYQTIVLSLANDRTSCMG